VKDYVMNVARIDAALLTKGNQPSKSLEMEGVHVISGNHPPKKKKKGLKVM